ncbi:MAG: hypothetical protein AB7P04_07000 [Bacteriovoracia bacterium]
MYAINTGLAWGLAAAVGFGTGAPLASAAVTGHSYLAGFSQEVNPKECVSTAEGVEKIVHQPLKDAGAFVNALIFCNEEDGRLFYNILTEPKRDDDIADFEKLMEGLREIAVGEVVVKFDRFRTIIDERTYILEEEEKELLKFDVNVEVKSLSEAFGALDEMRTAFKLPSPADFYAFLKGLLAPDAFKQLQDQVTEKHEIYSRRHLIGTSDQGKDMFSFVLYSSRRQCANPETPCR